MPRIDSTLEIPTARVFLPLVDQNAHKARYLGAEGGRGSGKSQIFAEKMIEECLARPIRAICLREVQKSLAESSKRLLEMKISEMGVGRQFRVMEAEIRTPHGGLIAFQGLRDHTAESIKSLEDFDIAFIEEAQRTSKRSWSLLRPTIRKPGSQIWAAWNPDKPTDPIDEWFNKVKPRRAIHVKANFYDNPFITPELLEEMRICRDTDKDEYEHVWLGGYNVKNRARVFTNWRVGVAPDVCKTDPRTGLRTIVVPAHLFGGDFGFANDPCVLVRCHIDETTKPATLYVTREIYRVGVEIDGTPDFYDSIDPDQTGQARKYTIVADSARPELISYLQRHGYPRVIASKKGKGSVEAGIAFLKSYQIVVDPSCVYTIKELTEYSYKVDKLSGNVLPDLEDEHNHVIDALRYALESTRVRKAALW